MNGHDFYRELLSAKVDGVLTDEERLLLEDHLAACPDCRSVLAFYEKIHEYADDLSVDPPENFSGTVLYRIDAARSLRRWLPRALSAAGVAAVLALVLWRNPFPLTNLEGLQTAQDMANPVSVEAVPESDTPGATAPSYKSFSIAPEEQPSEQGNLTIAFASNRFDPATAAVGDQVAGFRISSIQANYGETSKEVSVQFSGEATLSGTLYFDNQETGYWGKFVYFYIDDDCYDLLPYPLDDDRKIWFGFDNNDEVLPWLETHIEDEGETLAYRATIVINSYTVLQNPTEGANYATLKDILQIERIP